MQRANALEKTLMLGKIEDRGSGWQRTRWLDGFTDSMDMSEKTPGDNERQGSLQRCKQLYMTKQRQQPLLHELGFLFDCYYFYLIHNLLWIVARTVLLSYDLVK